MAGMKRTLIVKEFDHLIPESAKRLIAPSSNVTVLTDDEYDDLKDYLVNTVKEEGKVLFSASKKGRAIQLKNYVGMIELPKTKTRIEILPKIYSPTGTLSDKDLKETLLNMLSSLKDFPAVNLGLANVNLSHMALYEIFIRIFLGRVIELAKRGLRSDYLEIEENSSRYRGRLVVGEHIKHNAAHGERFYVRHDEYSLSRPENRIIKSAIAKLMKATEDQENAFLARRAMIYFDEVVESLDFEADYRRISFDISNQKYLGVIQWAMVFLRNRSFSIFGGGSEGQSLLFPMDRLFEQYVASQIGRLIKIHNLRYGTKYRFVSQEAAKYLFDVPKSFKIRPDIHIDGQDNILLDTKWKILDAAKRQNNISQGDMYQMYAYSKRYGAPLVYLLYPLSEYSDQITTRDYEASNDTLKTRVSLEFLDLWNMIENAKGDLIKDKNSLYSFLLKFLSEEPGTSKTITSV